jgi:hypothetical protein
MQVVERIKNSKFQTDELVHIAVLLSETGLYQFAISVDPNTIDDQEAEKFEAQNLAQLLYIYSSQFAKTFPIDAVAYLSLLPQEVRPI